MVVLGRFWLYDVVNDQKPPTTRYVQVVFYYIIKHYIAIGRAKSFQVVFGRATS